MSTKDVLEFIEAVALNVAKSLETEISADKLVGVVDEAREVFIELLSEVLYIDNPTHTMAESIFFSAVGLAFVEPAQGRGIDIHCVGRAIYDYTKQFNESMAGNKDPSQNDKARENSKLESEQSHQSTDQREFVWDIIEVPGEKISAYNVIS